MKSPVDYVLVKIEKAYQDEIITGGGVKLFMDTTFHPEAHTTILGEIIAPPEKLSVKEYGQHGNFINMEAGDKVCFSYLVVFDHDYNDVSKHFSLTEEIPGAMELWDNAIGEQIYICKFDSNTVAGVYRDKQNNVLDGKTGRWNEVESWKAQFSFEGQAIIKHNNRLWIDDEEYWRVDWRYMFFKVEDIQKGGHTVEQRITMAPGYTLILPDYREDIDRGAGQIILLQPLLANYSADAAGRVISNGPPLYGMEDNGLKKGDKVLFDKNFAEKYVINGQEVLILKHRYLIGRL